MEIKRIGTFSNLVKYFSVCKFSTNFNSKNLVKTIEIPERLSSEVTKEFVSHTDNNIPTFKNNDVRTLSSKIKDHCANTKFLETIQNFKEDPNFVILNLLGTPFNQKAQFNDTTEHAVSIYFISALANIMGYERHYDDKLPNPYIVRDSEEYFSGLMPHNDRTGMGVDLVSLTSINPSNVPTSFIPSELVYEKLSEKDREILSRKAFYLTGLQGNAEKTFSIINFDIFGNLKIEYRNDGTVEFKKDGLDKFNENEFRLAIKNLDNIINVLSNDKNSAIEMRYDKFSTVMFKNMIHFKEETVSNGLRVLIRNLYKDTLPKNIVEGVIDSKKLINNGQNLSNNIN